MREALLQGHATYIDKAPGTGFASQVAQVYKEITGNELSKKAEVEDARRAHERHHGMPAMQ